MCYVENVFSEYVFIVENTRLLCNAHAIRSFVETIMLSIRKHPSLPAQHTEHND
jgi:hypothetical protein